MRKALFLVLMFPLCAAGQEKKKLAAINKRIEEKRREQDRLAKQAERIGREIRGVQDRLVAASRNIKGHEASIADYDRQLSSMSASERALQAKAVSSGESLARIIAAFESIALVPAGYIFMTESGADEAFKTSVLLKAITQTLAMARDSYASDLSSLAELKDSILKAKLGIVSLNTRVKAEKSRISALIAEKKEASKALENRHRKAKRDIARLVAQSKTIEDFLKKEARLRARRDTFSDARSRRFTGKVSLPVAGFISTYFGDRIKGGMRSKGLYIKPKAGSRANVLSPTDAEVVFAGSFYGYKNLLILHSADNYYIIMGGLAATYASEGQSLLAGEPVGESGGGEFYLEIREGERVINPARYFKV
ncbi:MAG: peptidoglycan DD-metalloendopeptidase family protein [Rickettsiales bacterium]|jgi:septal ring factor EnvC (AmiA/AmiB activator)|nr:peptidoglycan DD-metalloendopeptidase family protein [Rickettsiales bacterium]